MGSSKAKVLEPIKFEKKFPKCTCFLVLDPNSEFIKFDIIHGKIFLDQNGLLRLEFLYRGYLKIGKFNNLGF